MLKEYVCEKKTNSRESLSTLSLSPNNKIKWSLLLIICTILAGWITLLVPYDHPDQIIYIDLSARPHKVNERFLSLGLDASIAAAGFRHFNLTSFKLISLVKHLTPCYLRLGGNLADKLLFVLDEKKSGFIDPAQFDNCTDYNCFTSVPNFTLSGSQWLRFNKFIRNSGADLIFDLNALLRNPDGSWNSTNAEELINFSYQNDLDLDWELGNEPNSFYYKFGEAVNASQLAKDYQTLKQILLINDLYKKSKLVGPSITRIRTPNISQYFRTFLTGASKVVSAITWHHYYFNGRNATPSEFLDPKVFDLLKIHIKRVQKVTKDLTLEYKPIWLGETSSAWGGGAPNLSNRFIDTFIWTDKLGLAAKMGVELVVRQSIFGGYYALLDENFDPNPDYWVSVIYKKLVDTRVVQSSVKFDSSVRLYAHCSKKNNYVPDEGSSIIVFGINIDQNPKKIRIKGISFKPFLKAFELTTNKSSLMSKNVFLNDHLLQLNKNYDLPVFKPKIVNVSKGDLIMPGYSVCFWLIHLDSTDDKYCK